MHRRQASVLTDGPDIPVHTRAAAAAAGLGPRWVGSHCDHGGHGAGVEATEHGRVWEEKVDLDVVWGLG